MSDGCLDCGMEYPHDGGDMLLPRSQWLLINPDDSGTLCAHCMMGRVTQLEHAMGIIGLIQFTSDYTDPETIYERISRLADGNSTVQVSRLLQEKGYLSALVRELADALAKYRPLLKSSEWRCDGLLTRARAALGDK